MPVVDGVESVDYQPANYSIETPAAVTRRMWMCGEHDPRPELRHLRSLFWLHLGGFVLPYLVVEGALLGLGIAMSLLRSQAGWIVMLVLLLLSGALSLLGLAASVRLYLAAKQYAFPHQWLAVGQVVAAAAFAAANIFFDFDDSYLPADVFFLAAALSFYATILRLHAHLDQTVPVTADLELDELDQPDSEPVYFHAASDDHDEQH